MKDITVYFTDSKFKTPVSWAIKKIERSEFCHCAIGFDINKKHIVYEAGPFGTHRVDIEDFEKLNKIVHTVQFTLLEKQFQTCKDYLQRYAGVSYGYKTLLGVLFARVCGSPNRYSDGDSTFICSEYVYNALKQVLTLPPMKAEKEGPQKLFEILSKIGSVR